jgi:uncharacterized damage-inducible protein DinB
MLKELVDDNIALLEQSHGLIAALPAEVYAKAPAGRRSGPGPHVRHILDHYRALVDAVAAGARAHAPANPVVDYEARARDERLERDPDFALATIEDLIGSLRALEGRAAETALEVSSDGHGGVSTLARELLFLLSHTVHHQALVALLLQPLGVEVDDCFGVAPSTLRHWGKLGPQAPLRDALGMAVHAGPEDA